MSLQDVEAEHGFTFGGSGESAHADPIAVVVCTAPTCPNRGHHVQVHTDHPLPLYCGGCGTVLHCDHDWSAKITTEGTLGAPVRVTATVCTVCGLQQSTPTREPLPAYDLKSLPASLLL